MSLIASSILGVAPVTENCLNSINKYSLEYKRNLMIICSRNQVECSSLGGGYFLNLSTEEFMEKIKLIKNKNPYLHICRDHSGPYTSNNQSDNFQIE